MTKFISDNFIEKAWGFTLEKVNVICIGAHQVALAIELALV
jgi:hypothetical protein